MQERTREAMEKQLAEATAKLEEFERTGYPENWMQWEMARHDAESTLNPCCPD
jgi:hypothetical protein